MTGMVGRHAITLNRGKERMMGYAGKIGRHLLKDSSDGGSPFGRNGHIAMCKAVNGLIAPPS